MNRIQSFRLGCLTVLAVVSVSFAHPVTAMNARGDVDSKVLAAFVAHVESLGQISETQKKQIRDLVGDPATASITDGLLSIYPDYSAAIESSDADDVSEGIKLLTPLADGTDPFLAADANFYLARLLMNNERFEEALPRLDKMTHELAEYSTHLGDAQYYIGVAQAGMLQKDEAIRSFMEFLQFNPDAAERLRVSAWRQVQELQAIQAGQLNDVHQHMDFSRRRLELVETDETTQQKQDNIVKMLGQLIKEAEKKECNSSCKNSNTEKQAENKPAPPKPAQEPKQGKSQQGGSSSNPNGDVVEKSYDDSPTSPWSRLRDRSRDPANNAVKEKLPARYRDIVEKYYEAANGDGKK